MKITHVITRLIIGGAQENTLLTCEGLAARGHDVTLIAGPTTGPEGSLVDRARAGHYRYLEFPNLVRNIHPIHDARAARALQQFFESDHPDVVHTHSSKAGILGRLAAAETNVPRIIHTIHGMSFNRTQPVWLQTIYAELERLCATRTHRIISVADAMTRAALEAGIGTPDQYVTIYSGMDVSAFDPAKVNRQESRKNLNIPNDAIVVATVARLFKNKGYEYLISAMQRAAEKTPALHFLWIGDGPDRPKYEAELEQRGLRTKTTLTGLIPPAQLPKTLAAADILAHASIWEGLPRAVVQALLLEIPAIAFNLDGAPEVIKPNETGQLVDPTNSAALAEAILLLVNDPTARAQMGRTGRAQCKHRFDHRNMVTQIEQQYGP